MEQVIFLEGKEGLVDGPLLETIKKMDRDCLVPAWNEEAWKDALIHPGPYLLGVFLTSTATVEGFVLFLSPPGDTMTHLLKILVLPAARGKGRGKRLLQDSMSFLFQKSKEGIFLEVESENRPALALYRALGFEMVHLAKNFFESGKHAVKMIRYLR